MRRLDDCLTRHGSWARNNQRIFSSKKRNRTDQVIRHEAYYVFRKIRNCYCINKDDNVTIHCHLARMSHIDPDVNVA